MHKNKTDTVSTKKSNGHDMTWHFFHEKNQKTLVYAGLHTVIVIEHQAFFRNKFVKFKTKLNAMTSHLKITTISNKNNCENNALRQLEIQLLASSMLLLFRHRVRRTSTARLTEVGVTLANGNHTRTLLRVTLRLTAASWKPVQTYNSYQSRSQHHSSHWTATLQANWPSYATSTSIKQSRPSITLTIVFQINMG